MLTFAEFPEQREKLLKNPALMPLAVEELVRFRSPAQPMFRETKADVEMKGQVIPRGSFVLAMLGSAEGVEPDGPGAVGCAVLTRVTSPGSARECSRVSA